MTDLEKALQTKKDEHGNPIPAEGNLNNNDEALKKETEKREKAERELAETVFTNGFEKLSTLYPHAADFKDEIKKKVDSGYTIDDAVIATLQKENKLVTAEQIEKAKNKGTDLGGSAQTDLSSRQSGDKEPTVDEAAQAFKDAEARGEIVLS